MTERREDIALEPARKILDFYLFGTSEEKPFNLANVDALLRPHVWEWIPVEERLPEPNKWVIGCVQHASKQHVTPVYGRIIMGGRFRWESEFPVTHWAALPSAPLSLESSNQK